MLRNARRVDAVFMVVDALIAATLRTMNSNAITTQDHKHGHTSVMNKRRNDSTCHCRI
jgi:hypothetical protein